MIEPNLMVHVRDRWSATWHEEPTGPYNQCGWITDKPKRRDYQLGITKPNYPMPAIRDVKEWDLWILYRPYPAQYVIRMRHLR